MLVTACNPIVVHDHASSHKLVASPGKQAGRAWEDCEHQPHNEAMPGSLSGTWRIRLALGMLATEIDLGSTQRAHAGSGHVLKGVVAGQRKAEARLSPTWTPEKGALGIWLALGMLWL